MAWGLLLTWADYWPAWTSRAACLGMGDMDPDPFFRKDAGGISDLTLEAKHTCGICTVRRECLSWAYESKHSTEFGVFGGTTGLEREFLADDMDALLALVKSQVIASGGAWVDGTDDGGGGASSERTGEQVADGAA